MSQARVVQMPRAWLAPVVLDEGTICGCHVNGVTRVSQPVLSDPTAACVNLFFFLSQIRFWGWSLFRQVGGLEPVLSEIGNAAFSASSYIGRQACVRFLSFPAPAPFGNGSETAHA